MELIRTPIDDLMLIRPKVLQDERGYFFESYNKLKFNQLGISTQFVQDNQSFSKYGTLRGLHFQKIPHAQAKLVRVIKGKILDVAVDIRPNSRTFGQHLAFELSDDNFLQVLIPKGFAHGFVVLSETALVVYKCDELYNAPSEGGIHYADPDLDIDWRVPKDKIILSPKDQKNPFLRELKF